MIKQFYKDFKVRDYMENEGNFSLENGVIMDCSLGTNPFIKNDIIKKYVEKASCDFNQYPINSYNNLKVELVKFWNKNTNAQLNINNVSFGSGSMGIIRNISNFLIDKDTNVLGCSPQFPRFISEVELKCGTYDYYSLKSENNYKFITNDFLKKIDKRYDVIYIDNPNNPTGQIIDVNSIEKIVKKAEEYDITVIIDEAYGDYMELNNSSITLVEKYNNIVVLKSASKFFGLPNHRIGYLIASEEFINVYDMITIPFPFSDLSCNIFTMMISNYDKLKPMKNDVIKANKRILEEIDKSNYLYTDIRTPIFTIKSCKYDNLTEELIKKGIISECCDNFINLDKKYARIRISDKYEQLIKILKEVL